jgi:hypothetical protein
LNDEECERKAGKMTGESYIAVMLGESQGEFDKRTIQFIRDYLARELAALDRPSIAALSRRIGVPRPRLSRILAHLDLHRFQRAREGFQ